jgi:hypothetical protein
MTERTALIRTSSHVSSPRDFFLPIHGIGPSSIPAFGRRRGWIPRWCYIVGPGEGGGWGKGDLEALRFVQSRRRMRSG